MHSTQNTIKLYFHWVFCITNEKNYAMKMKIGCVTQFTRKMKVIVNNLSYLPLDSDYLVIEHPKEKER